MQLKTFYLQDKFGNALPGALCYVYEHGTTTLVTTLRDADGQPLVNPVSADAAGAVQVAAPDGLYSVRTVAGVFDRTVSVQFIDHRPAALAMELLELHGSNVDAVSENITQLQTVADNVTPLQQIAPHVGTIETVSGYLETIGQLDIAAQVEHARLDAQAAAAAIGPIRFFDTLAGAQSAIPTLAEGDIVEISKDEGQDGVRSRRKFIGGVLVPLLLLDYPLRAEAAMTMSGYADLRSYGGTARTLILTRDGIAGTFQLDTADTTSTDNGGTVIVDAAGRRWKRVLFGHVIPQWFGAKGDGKTDDTAAIQAAIDVAKSIFFPAGTYRITGSITLSQQIFEITGVKGRSIIMGSGGGSIFGYFRVMQQFYADFGAITNLTFDSDDSKKTRWAIYSPSTVYISHWKIADCNFNARLTYGINANMIACHIYRCFFGVYFAGDSNNMKAIESIGTVGDGSTTVATTNINVIEQCEFANCGSPQSIVEFQTGFKVVFRDCIFEQLTPTATVVMLSGITFPVFEGCWFENAQGTTTVGKSAIWTRQDNNGNFAHIITVDNCLFHTYNTVPDGLINFGDSPRKHIQFSKNFVITLKSSIIVGGNSTAKFVNSFGNNVTVATGGDATELNYNSPAKYDNGIATTVVKFPAAQALSTDPNTLDDYSEETYVPSDSSGAGLVFTNPRATVTKIGRVVSFNLSITYPSTTDDKSAIVSKPPYQNIEGCAASVVGNTGTNLQAFVDGSGINLFPAGSFVPAKNSDMSGKTIYVSGTYMTNT